MTDIVERLRLADYLLARQAADTIEAERALTDTLANLLNHMYFEEAGDRRPDVEEALERWREAKTTMKIPGHMNVGSLFTGIGGLDLGLERAGMQVVWQSEIDPYCTKVLAKHWPNVPNLGDVTTIDWSSVENVDLVCGGYPCQPFSYAGTRSGENDPRHLWPHFARCIRHLRPRYALLENVPGHLSLGFGRVLGDLADLGYDAEWECIPAAAVGAPHLRYRVFVVAHARSARRRQDTGGPSGDEGPDARWTAEDDHVAASDGQSGGAGDVADTDQRSVLGGDGADRGDGRTVPIEGLERLVRGGGGSEDVADTEGVAVGTGLRQSGPGGLGGRRLGDGGGPVDLADTGGTGLEGRRLRGAVGNGDWWAVEPDVGRVAHGIPHRVDRLRALGNAVVPQVAEWIGHRIMNADAA